MLGADESRDVHPRSLECRKPLLWAFMGTVRQPAKAKSGLFRPLACLAPSQKLAARCVAGLAPGLGSSRPVSAHRRARASPMVPRAHGGEAMSAEIPMDCGPVGIMWRLTGYGY